MRDDISDTYGLVKLQDCILGIMVYIEELCKKHQIDYCLMGGSALGAKRHGGFIPWDDDLDIFMTPDNYEKFRDVFVRYGDKDDYYLQELGSANGMVSISKLRMNGTTFIEESVKNWDMHHGIYVDIFILHTCPNNKFLQLYQCFWAKYVIVLGLSNRDYNRKRGILGAFIRVFRLLPRRFLLPFALREVYRYRNVDTSYYCNFFGRAVFAKGIYKREWFESTEYVSFEKVQLKVPRNLHEFLRTRFGDYMQVPSPEHIMLEQHAWKWSVDRDFREFLTDISDFRDEKYLL